MARRGIFGGTFDPVHNGHLHIAYEALRNFQLDEVIFVPTGNPPHKIGRRILDASLRYEMVNMAIRDEGKFSISDYEMSSRELSYTCKTLEHFRKVYPDDKLFFLTGGDCLMELDTWKNVQEIFALSSLVVFNRPGYTRDDIMKQKKSVEMEYGSTVHYLDIPLLDISSTRIRECIREGVNVSYLMPSGVHNTIMQLGLYND